MLSGVFKDNPELIANTSLQMYYPLKRFDIMTASTMQALSAILCALRQMAK